MKAIVQVKALGAALGMILLILDSSTALNGASEGIELCLRTVIPSLFPFFVLSSLLTGAIGDSSPKILHPLWRKLGIPPGSEAILLTGLLGGYPIGAKCIADAVRQGRLNPLDGARMMAFCNNPGPAFIFGIAGSMFDHPWTGWILWGIQVAGALAVALILPGSGGKAIEPAKITPTSLPAALKGALQALSGVCGWVVLFRVAIAFLDRWVFWLIPEVTRVILCGLLELTNGCCMLTEIPNQGLRFIICSGLLAFGGLCVGMQTASVAQGVKLRWYLPGKLLHCLICMGMAAAVQGMFPGDTRMTLPPAVLPGILMLAGLLVFLRGKMKNRSGISGLIGV